MVTKAKSWDGHWSAGAAMVAVVAAAPLTRQQVTQQVISKWSKLPRVCSPGRQKPASLVRLHTINTRVRWEHVAARSVATHAACRRCSMSTVHQCMHAPALHAGVFNEQNFKNAFSVALAHAVYLPSASCFALLPVASQLGRTGSEAGCQLDYDPEKQAVVVTTPKLLRWPCLTHTYIHSHTRRLIMYLQSSMSGRSGAHGIPAAGSCSGRSMHSLPGVAEAAGDLKGHTALEAPGCSARTVMLLPHTASWLHAFPRLHGALSWHGFTCQHDSMYAHGPMCPHGCPPPAGTTTRCSSTTPGPMESCSWPQARCRTPTPPTSSCGTPSSSR